ncbi:MAG: hypothetical protein IJI56_03235 [Firmicutes bacterium]|nr:hypothetical protein [Bacillota bacterium]
MKKVLSLVLCLIMVFAMAACGKESGEWTRSGYFSDEAGNMVSITYMEDVTDPGWYVGFMESDDELGDSFGGMAEVKKNSLQGKLTSLASGGEVTVTINEDGEDGVLLKVKNGKEYHLVPYQMPTARFKVVLGTQGMGGVAYAQGTETPEYSKDEPYQWAGFGVFDDQVTYTITAYEYDDTYRFVKWLKDGEDFTTDIQFTVDIEADTEFTAVFEVK